MRTLVLNAGFEPMQLISWKRALCLVLIGKAEIVAEYNKFVRSVSTNVRLPSIVRLKRYVRVVQRLSMVRCTRRNIILRDNHQCQYCGVVCHPTAITIDHIVPRSKGGKTVWNNVVASCAHCNRKKGSRSLSDINMKLIKKPMRPTWSDIIGSNEHPIASEWLPYLSQGA
ncbi:MAG: HNH endonuclease [Oligoflexales bacterium]